MLGTTPESAHRPITRAGSRSRGGRKGCLALAPTGGGAGLKCGVTPLAEPFHPGYDPSARLASAFIKT